MGSQTLQGKTNVQIIPWVQPWSPMLPPHSPEINPMEGIGVALPEKPGRAGYCLPLAKTDHTPDASTIIINRVIFMSFQKYGVLRHLISIV